MDLEDVKAVGILGSTEDATRKVTSLLTKWFQNDEDFVGGCVRLAAQPVFGLTIQDKAIIERNKKELDYWQAANHFFQLWGSRKASAATLGELLAVLEDFQWAKLKDKITQYNWLEIDGLVNQRKLALQQTL